MKTPILLVVSGLILSGCMSAAQHRADVQDRSTDRMTVGTVQKEIRVGMSGGEVATVLGWERPKFDALAAMLPESYWVAEPVDVLAANMRLIDGAEKTRLVIETEEGWILGIDADPAPIHGGDPA